MRKQLYGWGLRVHVVFLCAFLLLFAMFAALGIVSALSFAYTPFQWVVMGFLTLSAGLSAAWEWRAVAVLRRASRDERPSA